MNSARTPIVNSQIELDETGRAWLRGTQIKVIEVALDKIAYGWSPEEIHFQHPSLSLSQIYAALAYYYEHQTEFDTEIVRQVNEADSLAAKARAQNPTLYRKLREAKEAKKSLLQR